MVDDLTKTIIVHGKYVFTNFEEEDGGVIKNGAVVIQNETIIATGLFKLLREEYPDAVIVGTDKDYVLPGIIDAHSHGQGLSYVQRGFAYDYLENCLFDWKRSCNLSDELNAKLTALKHLRNGGTMVHVNQYIENPSAFSIDRIKAIIDTYRKCGIRFAYSPGMKDINRLSNNDEELYDYLPVKLQSFAKPMFFPDQNELIDNYETLFRQLRAEIHDDLSCILQGPYWAHGLSDLFLERIAQLETDYNDTPVHIHTLQTPYQRKYGEKKYGKSLLFHLNDYGLVNKNLVLGHAVYLSEKDISLLAEKKASVTHHASCNLYMRNGIAPVYNMIKEGVNVALGIDEKQLNDDEDVLQELKLIFALHRMSSYDLGTNKPLRPHEVLKIGTCNAAKTVGLGGKIGMLKPGFYADIITIDSKWIEENPWIAPDHEVLNTLVHRMQGRFIKDVIVNGNITIQNYKIMTLSVADLYEEIRDYMETNYKHNNNPDYEKYLQIKSYYQEIESGELEKSSYTFYELNKK